MSSVARGAFSRRDRAALFAVALFPLAAFLALRALGYLKLVRLGVVAAAAVAFAVTMFVRPRWGLYFVLFWVYSGLGTFIPVNAAVLVTFLVFAAVVLDLIRGDHNRLVDASFWYANAAFVLICLQSMLVARDPGLALFELSNYGKMMLVTYLIVHLMRTREDLHRLIYVVFVGAVATVYLGLAGLVLGIGPEPENYVGGVYLLRFTGAHENPNRAAAFMCSALPLGLACIKLSRRPWERAALIVGAISLIVAVFSTFSRSVIMPFAVITLAIVIREIRSRRSYVMLIAFTALGILLAPQYYWERVFGLKDALNTSGMDWSVYTRWLALTSAWELFLQHPLTGIGLGNFVVAAAHKVFLRIVVHNSYLEILVGTGVFGLLAFLGVVGSGVRHAVTGARHRWADRPEQTRTLSFYVLLSSVSIAMSAFFGTMPFRYPLWVPVAAGLVIGNLLRDEAPAPRA